MPPSTVSSDADELEELAEPRRTVHPARRTRLRRIVVGVIGGAALLSTIAAARLARTSATKGATAMAATQLAIDMPVTPSIEPVEAPAPSTATAPTPPPEPAPVVSAAPEPTPVVSAAPEPAPVASAAPEPTPVVSAAPGPAPVVSAVPTPAPSAAAALDPPALKREARSLVDRGKMRAAIPAAEAGIDADPGDAESYLLLGAALQEVGQWKRSIEVFSRCVHEATRGPLGECRALGGH